MMKILFLSLLFVNIDGYSIISNNLIKTDLLAARKLHAQYLNETSVQYAIQTNKIRCSIVEECCPEKGPELSVIIFNDEIAVTCLDYKNLSSYLNKSLTCRNLVETFYGMEEVTNRFFNEYFDVGIQICSPEEIESFYCQPENLDLFQSCLGKMLRHYGKIAQGKRYDKFVNHMANIYTI